MFAYRKAVLVFLVATVKVCIHEYQETAKLFSYVRVFAVYF